VGTGILALPYAMKSAGIVMGSIMMIIASLFSLMTLLMLLIVANKKKLFCYKDIANDTFSRYTGIFVEIMIFFFSIGVLAVFTGIIGDYMSSILTVISISDNPSTATLFFVDKRVCSAIVLITIVFPLCCLRRIQFLSYTSIMSIFSIIFVIIVVVVKLCENGMPMGTYKKPHKVILVNTDEPLGIFMAFPVVFFSYASHTNFLSMYEEMRNRNYDVMKKTTSISILLISFMYAVMAICGYLLFVDDTMGNILNGFNNDELVIIIAKASLMLVVITSFPLIHFSARQGVDRLLFPNTRFSWTRFITEAIIICLLVYGLSVLIPDLADLAGLTGATIGTLIQFVFPSLFFLKTMNEWHWRILAIICIITSVSIGGMGTVSVVMDFVYKKFM
jgi:amino acid permease